jgi:hypothetical protein
MSFSFTQKQGSIAYSCGCRFKGIKKKKKKGMIVGEGTFTHSFIDKNSKAL